MRQRRRLVAALLLMMVGAGPAAAQPAGVGETAPDIAGERWLNSGPLTVTALRGRVVLVEFWTYG